MNALWGPDQSEQVAMFQSLAMGCHARNVVHVWHFCGWKNKTITTKSIIIGFFDHQTDEIKCIYRILASAALDTQLVELKHCDGEQNSL